MVMVARVLLPRAVLAPVECPVSGAVQRNLALLVDPIFVAVGLVWNSPFIVAGGVPQKRHRMVWGMRRLMAVVLVWNSPFIMAGGVAQKRHIMVWGVRRLMDVVLVWNNPLTGCDHLILAAVELARVGHGALLTAPRRCQVTATVYGGRRGTARVSTGLRMCHHVIAGTVGL